MQYEEEEKKSSVLT